MFYELLDTMSKSDEERHMNKINLHRLVVPP